MDIMRFLIEKIAVADVAYKEYLDLLNAPRNSIDEKLELRELSKRYYNEMIEDLDLLKKCIDMTEYVLKTTEKDYKEIEETRKATA